MIAIETLLNRKYQTATDTKASSKSHVEMFGNRKVHASRSKGMEFGARYAHIGSGASRERQRKMIGVIFPLRFRPQSFLRRSRFTQSKAR
jgi:hypothetical protein